MIFRFGVAFDIDGVQLERFAFTQRDIQIDRIGFNDLFLEFCLEGEVAAIKIKRADIAIVLREIEPLLNQFCIIDITFFDFEGGIKNIRCCKILGIACPGNIADIIFLPFIKINVKDKAFFVIGITDRIAYYPGIAVAVVSVELDKEVFVVVEYVGIEFWRAEDLAPPGVLMGFIEHPPQFFLIEGRVAVECYLFNGDLCSFSDRNQGIDMIFTVVLQVKFSSCCQIAF